ncbi:synaptotagmin-7-like isoform X2 [Anneissia japonica]|nr:synaptotagmin-7-like isoform X2 [Anneissia japonica]
MDGVPSEDAGKINRAVKMSTATPPEFIIPLQPMTQRAPVVVDTLTTRSRERSPSGSSQSSLDVTPVRIATESTLLSGANSCENISTVGNMTPFKPQILMSGIHYNQPASRMVMRTTSVPAASMRRQQLYRVPSGVATSFRAFAPSMEDLQLIEGRTNKATELCFAVEHFTQEEKLRIVIDKATRIQIPEKQKEHFKQPLIFVRGCMLPGKQKKFKTKNSPISNMMTDVDWQEVFDLEGISFSAVWQITILLEVYIKETSGRRKHRLGICELPLEDVDLSTRQAFVMELQDSTPEPELGDLHISIVYQASNLRVVMYIAEARDLPKPTGNTSYFVKVELFHYQTRLEKKRTKMIKGTSTPKWTEQIVFLVPPGNVNMDNVRFTISLMSKDMVKSNHVIGMFELGWDSSCEELEYWTDVVNNHNRPIVQWLSLQNPNDYR